MHLSESQLTALKLINVELCRDRPSDKMFLADEEYFYAFSYPGASAWIIYSGIGVNGLKTLSLIITILGPENVRH